MPRAKRGQVGHLDLRRQLRSASTEPEKKVWDRLRARQFAGLKFRRQHGIGPYIVDFYCPEQSLVIEIDGESHAEIEQMLKDEQRNQYLVSLNLRVVRYNNSDIMKNIDGVLTDLLQRLSSIPTSPNPSLPRRGTDN